MSLTLTQNSGGNFTPHPEGIHHAVCVDVIDLGFQNQTFQGETKVVQKIKVVFETECKTEDDKAMTISKNFTASLHPKATLNKFLSKWRGKEIADGENIDLQKLISASCTLVISESTNELTGKKFTGIDAVSKPTKKLTPSGDYNAETTRKKIFDWMAKNGTVIAAPQQKQSQAEPSDNDGGNVDAPGF